MGAEMEADAGVGASSSVIVAKWAETGVEAGSSVVGEEVVAIGADPISLPEIEPAPWPSDPSPSVDDRALEVKIPSY